jgi:mRNA interferase MazF
MGLVTPKLDEVWMVALDPAVGFEIQKSRPCLVVSPDEMNQRLRTVIVAPMTRTERPYPTRVTVRFQGKDGQIALDQIRSVDRQRLIQKLGTVTVKAADAVSAVLVEMFMRDRVAPAR